MSAKTITACIQLIYDHAREFGADLVGIANMADLKRSPSHTISANMPAFTGVDTNADDHHQHGMDHWPEGAKAAVVIGVEHPVEKPELDWWVTGEAAGNTAGNHLLMRTVSKLAVWLERDQGMHCFPLPYHIERGGVSKGSTRGLRQRLTIRQVQKLAHVEQEVAGWILDILGRGEDYHAVYYQVQQQLRQRVMKLGPETLAPAAPIPEQQNFW